MISEFVSNTMRNCDGILNITSNSSVFSDNVDKLESFEKNLNNSYELYTTDSMNAIKTDLIKIGLSSVDWKKEQQKLISEKKATKEEIETIELKKPSYKTLSSEYLENIKRDFKNSRKEYRKQIRDFPKEITRFENTLVSIRNNNVKTIKKITKQLLNEHRRFVNALMNGEPFDKTIGIQYIESQKEFVKENLKNFIIIS